MSSLYAQIDMLRQERDEARADRDQLAKTVARMVDGHGAAEVATAQLLSACEALEHACSTGNQKGIEYAREAARAAIAAARKGLAR